MTAAYHKGQRRTVPSGADSFDGPIQLEGYVSRYETGMTIKLIEHA